VGISGDAATLALSLAALLLVGAVLALPPVLRAIRLRRLHRVLGALYWPFLYALDARRWRRKKS
jgi:hypothetical protein